jgi:hypothetical protein
MVLLGSSRSDANNSLYVYPNLPQTGLANMLFIWARAEIFARDRRCKMLAPQWTQFGRVGVWLRGERDKRTYLNCFGSDGYVSGFSRARILLTYPRISEEKAAEIEWGGEMKRKLVVDVQGSHGNFDTFPQETEYLRGRLLAIIRPRLVAQAHDKWPATSPFIALHVRRGDFAPWDSSRVGTAVGNVQLPIPWFREAIRFIRQQAGPLPAVIFTDGAPQDVKLLTDLPDVVIAEHAPAIVHIVAIANASHIVTSASTFSRWGVYLSEATAIWYPGVGPCPRTPKSADLVMDFGIK